MILESRAVKPVDFRVDFAHLFLCLAGNTNFVTRLSTFRPRKLEEPVKTTQNNDTVSIDLIMCFLIQGRLGLWGIYRTSSQSITSACAKDIKSHLRQMKVAQNSAPRESDLFLARVGLFGRDGCDMTICPKHRAALGTRASLKCQHPLHTDARRNKPERGANLQMSQEIMAKWKVLVPVGAGMKAFFVLFNNVAELSAIDNDDETTASPMNIRRFILFRFSLVRHRLFMCLFESCTPQVFPEGSYFSAPRPGVFGGGGLDPCLGVGVPLRV